MVRSLVMLLCVLAAACSESGGQDDPEKKPPEQQIYPAGHNSDRDILSTALDVALDSMTATATISLAGSDSAAASFEAQGLVITAVRDAAGEPLLYEIDPPTGRLDVGVSPSEDPVTVEVDYAYAVQDSFNGALAGGSTLIWPYHCGNLFPCRSTPADGLRFEMNVHSDPLGRSIIYPETIGAEVPSYVAAWAVGDYAQLPVGQTTAGTELLLWFSPGSDADAAQGAAHLLAAFEYFEAVLGPYAFGERSGGVSVDWGPGAIGGMEHHPYWHVGADALGRADVHVHEAAHGWFGDGVRIACWEDFVLSEGTVSYLTARAFEAVATQPEIDSLWLNYNVRLNDALATQDVKIAWPDSCGQTDIIEDGYFSSIPYMKGAFFFKALENRVGVDPLLSALSTFYNERVGTAARMQELLDTIAMVTGYDPSACAQAWLRQEAVPSDDTCPP